MMKTLGSMMIMLGGIALVILSFYNNHKKIVNKDNNRLKKYLKCKKSLNIIVGFCYVILGAVSILNIYNGDLIWIGSLIILFCDKVLEFVINNIQQNIF
ncbi:hypothetical protein NRP93_001356 [Clostridium botulinum]|nr:hypothetical protein [Clostridium botulinum]